MLVVMDQDATEAHIEAVIDRLVGMGFTVHRSTGVMHTVLGGVGPLDDFDPAEFEVMPGVKECHRIVSPYKLASRHFRPSGTVVRIGDVEIGGEQVFVAAGPCSVENREQIEESAERVAQCGAKAIRGGAFKPRSSPYSFQGLGEAGLRIMREAADRHGLLVVSEVMDHDDLAMMLEYCDILQVGARNMQNFVLLTEVGRTKRPVLLKRGMAASVTDLLMSAEYILSQGNPNVVLCERGVRGFDNLTRNLFDVAAVALVKRLSHLPIIVDPSHATGRPDIIPACALAGIAAGADGVHIEVHDCPEVAKSDGPQALLPAQFDAVANDIRRLAALFGSQIAPLPTAGVHS